MVSIATFAIHERQGNSAPEETLGCLLCAIEAALNSHQRQHEPTCAENIRDKSQGSTVFIQTELLKPKTILDAAGEGEVEQNNSTDRAVVLFSPEERRQRDALRYPDN